MALDLLVELEIVKARDRVNSPRRSPTDEARRYWRRMRPPYWCGRGRRACFNVVAFPRRGQTLDEVCGAVLPWWRRTRGDAVT